MKRTVIESLIFTLLLSIHEVLHQRLDVATVTGFVLGGMSFAPLYWMAVLRFNPRKHERGEGAKG